ncbi:MAG: hypothetical protein KAR43_06380, partial [Deltaproteobacteria bacterium]|nr:hypothetical protein [Deltaproteobacteria bacterium]
RFLAGNITSLGKTPRKPVEKTNKPKSQEAAICGDCFLVRLLGRTVRASASEAPRGPEEKAKKPCYVPNGSVALSIFVSISAIVRVGMLDGPLSRNTETPSRVLFIRGNSLISHSISPEDRWSTPV